MLGLGLMLGYFEVRVMVRVRVTFESLGSRVRIRVGV